MEHNEPQWHKDTKKHNAITQLKLVRAVQPLIMFAIVFFLLKYFKAFESQYIIFALAALFTVLDWLALNWLIKKLEGGDKDNTIG